MSIDEDGTRRYTSAGAVKTLKHGRYELLGVLGEGSQGETFEARDASRSEVGQRPRPERLADDFHSYVARARGAAPRSDTVAIKCFRIGRAKEWKDVELAEREATTLASLDHPKLPRYVEHFEEDGVLYLVMEKIEGESLARLRSRRVVLGADDVVRMLEDVADALRYLHGRAPAIIHRDVKPGNILRRPDGSFALVDLGSVRDRLKPAGGSTVVGTFGYMAPEQFQGRAAPKSDVYGLGVTAITMLTGTDPEDLPHTGLGIDVARALPRSLPPHLVRTLTRMVEPDPDRRLESVDEALALLRIPRPSKAPPPSKRGTAPERPQAKRSKRDERSATRRERRRHRRALARSRGTPFIARFFAHLGLAIALMAVWLAVGVVAPLVLSMLSLVFGPALRRAARACVRAAQRSQKAIGRAAEWVSGERDEDALPGAGAPNVRVALDELFVRVAEDGAHGSEEAEGREGDAEPLQQANYEITEVPDPLEREEKRAAPRPPKPRG